VNDEYAASRAGERPPLAAPYHGHLYSWSANPYSGKSAKRSALGEYRWRGLQQDAVVIGSKMLLMASIERYRFIVNWAVFNRLAADIQA